MKPKNYRDRKNTYRKFALFFILLLGVFFVATYLTIQTGQRGVKVLSDRYAMYAEVFEKQAALSYEIDHMIKKINQLKNKNRTFNQHKHFQEIVSNTREAIALEINENEQKAYLEVYTQMIDIIKEIQNILDAYKEDSESYDYYDDLLTKCKEKYVETLKKQHKYGIR